MANPLVAKLVKSGHHIEATVQARVVGPNLDLTPLELCKNCLIQVVSEGEESMFNQIMSSPVYGAVPFVGPSVQFDGSEE